MHIGYRIMRRLGFALIPAELSDSQFYGYGERGRWEFVGRHASKPKILPLPEVPQPNALDAADKSLSTAAE